MEEREVYIGNNKTVKVVDSDKVRFCIDLNKVRELLEKNENITIGASGDWFFTATTINKNDLEKIMHYKKYLLMSSGWSKFEARINEESVDITLEVPLNMAEVNFRDGFFAGLNKIVQWFPKMYQCIKKLDYETIKKLQAEINPIIDKYSI